MKVALQMCGFAVPGAGTSKMGESIARFCALAKTQKNSCVSERSIDINLFSSFLWGCKADVDFNLYMIFVGQFERLQPAMIPWNLLSPRMEAVSAQIIWASKKGRPGWTFVGGKIYNPNGTDHNFPWRLKTLKLYAPMIWKAKKILYQIIGSLPHNSQSFIHLRWWSTEEWGYLSSVFFWDPEN